MTFLSIWHVMSVLCLWDKEQLLPVSFQHTSFKTIRSGSYEPEDQRGGVAVLITHKLFTSVYDVNKLHDQVWFSQCVIPRVRFGAAGHDGLPPGCLRLLPLSWIPMLTFFMNPVFTLGYPIQWIMAKVFTIHRKGPRSIFGNYRGISILCALSKLNDCILNNRLNLWFKPDLEQARREHKLEGDAPNSY